MSSTDKGTEFERTVCEILYQTNPYNISHYIGGADRGKDILLQYKIGTQLYDVIVECKNYTKPVNKEVVMPALDWAKIHRPALLYFWITPNLTPSAKDYIKLFSEEYKIAVQFEESLNIERYISALQEDDYIIFYGLKTRITNSINRTDNKSLVNLEYDNQISVTDHYLVNREIERNILLEDTYKAFYVQGVSACGKTQLIKNIVYLYNQKGKKIFWHTVRTDESEQQNKAFYTALAHFFTIVCNDSKLEIYLSNHGYYLSNELLSILTLLFNIYEPILVIDDVHKCQTENVILKETFETIIENKLCRIYFIGWFNIFKKSFLLNKAMKVLVLEGLADYHLDQIIIHNIGQSKKEIATLIQDKYNGLPGYAILVDENTSQDTMETNDTFLHGFINCLTSTEKKALFILTFSSIPIELHYWTKFDLIDSIYSLVEKRLIECRGTSYNIHDKYRPFFKNYPLNNLDFQDVVTHLKEISSYEIEISLDLIDLYIDRKQIGDAYIVLQNSFQNFLHKQLIKNTLKRVQMIEDAQFDNQNLIDLLKMKIILLERLSQHTICINYINMIQSETKLCTKKWEKIYYIYLRCLYFTNQYDILLKSVSDNRDYISENTSTEIRIQIFLVTGRVYYIRGDLETALILYLLSYQNALGVNNLSLVMKSIHRIAMVECCCNYISESKNTFYTLSKLDNIITPKRKSYAYYRIAKCCYLLDELDDGIEYTKKSISIKESFGDLRGFAFSYKTYAKIFFKQNKFVEAIYYINEARNVALKLGLNKEVLSINIILIENILKYHIDYNMEELKGMLVDGLKIAIDEKLLYRIHTIMELSEHKWDDLYNISKKEYNEIEDKLKEETLRIKEYYYNSLDQNAKNDFDLLLTKQKPISSGLLINSGIIPSPDLN